ncbi:glycosyltransferase [Microbacterium esteraromaticum]|uniref:glycosyltransferase n=1 Tax=Microbacterium esteraromaticum TaxID=57043 RepID=UPI0019564303|nr:glycosyltransferase [Microbacterium esteraromaticum]MBM7464635.1 UDP:flavonoid glycosyltransferase YjiC (YdhE family) [Microbacterium esteraromaticum]
MTLLIISPDYASHLLPLASLGTAWRDDGHEVVVATGPATAAIVSDFGYRRTDLRLGRGANGGVIRSSEQQTEEAESLEGFFAATRIGMVSTLAYQASERLTDLMWQPVDAAQATLRIIKDVSPDAILVDHLAYSARVALHARGIAYGDVVLGHPSALPVAGEVYGYPPAWPTAFSPHADELGELRTLCEEVSRRFTKQWNDAAAAIEPHAEPVADAFALHGSTVLYNYPAQLAAGDGRTLPPHRFLGSTPRDEPVISSVDEWMATGEPYVYVSFGSFLSVRGDVLARVAAALRAVGVRAAIATGTTDAAELGHIPDGWLIAEYLPQVRLLSSAAAAVTHGGNNSVTEAVASGVPLMVLPFSTDQFAGAAAIERAGVGRVLDPNAASIDQLAAALREIVDPAFTGRAALRAAADEQQAHPGPSIARTVVPTIQGTVPGSGTTPTSRPIADGEPAAAR